MADGSVRENEGGEGIGFGIQDSGFRIQDSGFRIQDSGFRIQDSFGVRITWIVLSGKGDVPAAENYLLTPTSVSTSPCARAFAGVAIAAALFPGAAGLAGARVPLEP